MIVSAILALIVALVGLGYLLFMGVVTLSLAIYALILLFLIAYVLIQVLYVIYAFFFGNKMRVAKRDFPMTRSKFLK